MSKNKSRKELQMEFDWDFPSKLEKVMEDRNKIHEKAVVGPAKRRQSENEFDLCVTLAAACQKAISRSDLSRDQVVDEINVYFGRNHKDAEKDEGICRKPLSIHMLNNYLSKPAENPIPGYYLFAIQHITQSLEPARELVEAEGAKIATGDEIRQLNIGKLEEHLDINSDGDNALFAFYANYARLAIVTHGFQPEKEEFWICLESSTGILCYLQFRLHPRFKFTGNTVKKSFPLHAQLIGAHPGDFSVPDQADVYRLSLLPRQAGS